MAHQLNISGECLLMKVKYCFYHQSGLSAIWGDSFMGTETLVNRRFMRSFDRSLSLTVEKTCRTDFLKFELSFSTLIEVSLYTKD